MKRYVFTLAISGSGNNEADAWDSAVEQFTNDPGTIDYHDDKIIEVRKIDGGEDA